MNNLSVIVPFFNEEKYLEESVTRLLDQEIFSKIILVNDCSNDESLTIAKNLAEKFDIIETISTKQNKGKGNAIKEGLESVETTHVIVHDADLEYFPDDIPEMFEIAVANQNSLILGSRTIGHKKRISLYKTTYFAQKIYALIFSLLNNCKISDIASCYWLISTDSLREMNISSEGFSIEVEVLSKALRNKIKVIETPIKYHARSYDDGKKIKIYDGLQILIKIVALSKAFSFLNFFKIHK